MAVKIVSWIKLRLQETFGHKKCRGSKSSLGLNNTKFCFSSIYTKAYRAPLEGYNACLNGKKMQSLVFHYVVYAFNEAEKYNGSRMEIQKKIKKQDCEVRICRSMC